MKSSVFIIVFLLASILLANDSRAIRYAEGNQAPASFKQYKSSQPVNLNKTFAYDNGGAKDYKYKYVAMIKVDDFDDFAQKIFLIDRYAYWLDSASEDHADYPGDMIAYYACEYNGRTLCYIVWFSDLIKNHNIFDDKYWSKK